jgi:uroporphyrinogen III methyltransferase/synthase
MTTGKVVIVGAGPGDPRLITVKGLEALKKADVVIYDRLIPKELLNKVKRGAELVFAGKAPGVRILTQEEINQLMVEKAREGKLVVRLKGGDPMVLSRSGEEIAVLARAGVKFEVVPGVTSAIATLTAANIPITCRGLSSSFVVAAGKEDPSKSEKSVDFRKIAKAADTIIVLMGLGRLEEICRELIEGGLRPTTHAALIKDATTSRQVIVEGTLGNIARKAQKAGLKPPAVFVVGQVIEVRRELEALRRGEKLILAFRPKETAGELEALLAEGGYTCINIPAACVKSVASVVDVKKALTSDVDYAIFTSQIGVRVLERILAEEELWRQFISVLERAKVITIGSKSREALKRRGVRVDIVPEKYCSHELAKMLKSCDLRSAKVVLFRSADADKSIDEELKKAGADVRAVATHRLEPSDQLSAAAELVENGYVRALVLTSSLIAKFVDQKLREVGISLSKVSETVKVFSIGPATSRTLVELGVKSFIEASEHTARGLCETMIKTLRSEDHE